VKCGNTEYTLSGLSYNAIATVNCGMHDDDTQRISDGRFNEIIPFENTLTPVCVCARAREREKEREEIGKIQYATYYIIQLVDCGP